MVADLSPERPLNPGNVIKLEDVTELATFEDLIAKEVEPGYDHTVWSGRVALKHLIRPPKFNGTIADIQLAVMEHPYERLIDAGQRGWKIKGGANLALTNEFAARTIPKYRGFVLAAIAKSSGRGTIGQVQAEMWYYPFPLFKPSGRTYLNKNYSNNTGQAIRRVVTIPKIEKKKFVEFDEGARYIGIDLLRKSLAHPISTPMRD